MSVLSSVDHQMIHRARDRGQVVVTIEQRSSLAVLWAWRPTRNGKRTNLARVEFGTGRFASVPCNQITLPKETP